MNSIRLSLFVFLYLFLLIIPPFYIDKLLSNYFYFDNGIYRIFMMLFYGFYGYFVVLLLFKKLIPNHKGHIRLLLCAIIFVLALTKIGREYIGNSFIFTTIFGAFIASGLIEKENK